MTEEFDENELEALGLVGAFDNDNLDDDGTLPEKPALSDVLNLLERYDGGLPDPAIMYGLSGLMRGDIDNVRPVWLKVAAAFRHRMVRAMVESSENDIMMDYREMGFMGLDDPDPRVRESAVELLWEDESLELMHRLIQLAHSDDHQNVRAGAVSALGRFILLGELEHLPLEETLPAQETAIALLTNMQEEVDVRRRALEAIANCSHDIVPRAIKEAYHSQDLQMRVSSVFAMGRTCDDQWGDYVLEELKNSFAELRYEAARAAGAIELEEAIPHLGRLLLEDDREIVEASIWALGEIGGKEASRLLEMMAEKAEDEEDDELMIAVEDALGNAQLSDDLDFGFAF